MGIDWVKDIEDLHDQYQVHERLKGADRDRLKALLEFRIKFLEEELIELRTADTAEDVVDAIIDLCVVAIGTLDSFDVDSYLAWDRVLEANKNKKIGIKPSRPNPTGLPDLVKPEGWTAPTHHDNVGLLGECFNG